MNKRLLCYDVDNPVGVDENGVLDSSKLGGGSSEPDMVITIGEVHSNAFVEYNASTATIVSGNYNDLVNIIYSGKMPVVKLEAKYVYSGVVYPLYFYSQNVYHDMNGLNVGGTMFNNGVSWFWSCTVDEYANNDEGIILHVNEIAVKS